LGQQPDVVYGTAACIGADSPVPLRFDSLRLALFGLGQRNGYSPTELDSAVIPASCLVLRRQVLERLGGWRLARDCIIEPSQDLVFWAWRAGFRLRAVNLVTLVHVASGHRRDSYLVGGAAEQEWFLERLEDPSFATELAALALETNASYNRRSRRRPRPTLRLLAGVSAKVGINPQLLQFGLRRLLGRGEYLQGLRALRGLPTFEPPPGDGPALRFEMVRRSCGTELPASTSPPAPAGPDSSHPDGPARTGRGCGTTARPRSCSSTSSSISSCAPSSAPPPGGLSWMSPREDAYSKPGRLVRWMAGTAAWWFPIRQRRTRLS
jgi:hypothetical protein